MQKMFMCYHTANRTEVDAFVQEMRLRGIAMWFDHEGGLAAGDNVQAKARRVIGDPDETFGLLVYVTEKTLDRAFIRRIEMHAALQRKDIDPSYVLMAVPRQIDFKKLSRLSLQTMGDDLTAFHSHAIAFPDIDSKDITLDMLRPHFETIADMVLRKRLILAHRRGQDADVVGINLCTREYVPPSTDDLVDINATPLFGGNLECEQAWARVWTGLRNMKKAVRETLGIVRVRVRGSKHLTAAFLIGRVFPPSTVRELQVQQGRDLWSSTCVAQDSALFDARLVDGVVGSSDLFVEITATEKRVRPAVQRYIARRRQAPFAYLRIEPQGGPRIGAVTNNATACAMAIQVREEIAKAVEQRGIERIHLFVAIPQGLMTLIGYHLNATVPVQLYEYDGQDYTPSLLVSGTKP